MGKLPRTKKVGEGYIVVKDNVKGKVVESLPRHHQFGHVEALKTWVQKSVNHLSNRSIN